LQLKNIVIIDVMVLSLGFCCGSWRNVRRRPRSKPPALAHLRHACLSAASSWALASAARRLSSVRGAAPAAFRRAWKSTNLPLLAQIITIITTSTLIAYTFYSFGAAIGAERTTTC
jgi:hypothetical protein